VSLLSRKGMWLGEPAPSELELSSMATLPRALRLLLIARASAWRESVARASNHASPPPPPPPHRRRSSLPARSTMCSRATVGGGCSSALRRRLMLHMHVLAGTAEGAVRGVARLSALRSACMLVRRARALCAVHACLRGSCQLDARFNSLLCGEGGPVC
jgi:hypothetical protein